MVASDHVPSTLWDVLFAVLRLSSDGTFSADVAPSRDTVSVWSGSVVRFDIEFVTFLTFMFVLRKFLRFERACLPSIGGSF